jgi:hypothetical protein
MGRAHAEGAAGLGEALALLLRRAQEAGAVRDDIGLPELMAVLVGASLGAEQAGGGGPGGGGPKASVEAPSDFRSDCSQRSSVWLSPSLPSPV